MNPATALSVFSAGGAGWSAQVSHFAGTGTRSATTCFPQPVKNSDSGGASISTSRRLLDNLA